MKSLATALTFFLFIYHLNAQVVYVDPAATGNGNGASWANAITDIQAGIDAAASVATAANPIQVWVKSGTYFPTTGTDRQAVFVLKNAVELYGGFDGTEALLGDRDITANPTILSADIGVSADRTDNTYNLLLLDAGVTEDVIIDGLVFRDADQSIGGSTNGNGIGVIVTAGTPNRVNVTNCEFYANNGSLGSIAGFHGLTFGFQNCIFGENGFGSSNQATFFVVSNDITSFKNCLFYGNNSPIVRLGGTLNIVNSTFSENLGDVVALLTQTSGISASINNSIFWNNSGSDITVEVGAESSTSGSNNLVEGGFSIGINTLTANPQFVDPSVNDYRLSLCSPALNQGDNSLLTGVTQDLDGAVRIFNSTIDLGPYENQENPLFLSAVEVGPVQCAGESTGSISVNAGGGSGSPLEYSVDGTSFQASGLFENLAAGDYDVFVRDTGANCTYSEVITVTEATPITFDVSITTSPAMNVIVVQASGGNGGYTYSLDGVNFQSGDLPITTTGLYEIFVRDAIGCIVSQSFYLTAQGRIVVFLDPTAVGDESGLSWTNAVTDLQSAIDLASQLISNSGEAEVWTKSGTYYPDIQSSTDRTKRIEMKNNVSLLGGFAGTETESSQRDVKSNLTILSGDIGVASDSTDNSYGLVNVGGDVADQATIDGWRLEGAFSLAVEPENGAIALSGAVGDFYIKNCTFRYNLSNQGACIRTAEATGNTSRVFVESSIFANNGFFTNTGYIGSAIYVKNEVSIYNSLFIDNKSGVGAAIYINPVGGSLSVINSTFFDNAAGTAGSVIYDATAGNATVDLKNNVIWGNFGATTVNVFTNLGSTLTASNNLYSQILNGTGNILADPEFVDESTYDLRLKHCSPAVNTGDDSFLPMSASQDLSGNPRQFNLVDMGAYETQESPITITLVGQTDVPCNGQSDGEIEVSAVGGSNALEYSIDGTNFSTATQFSGLQAGAYTVTVRDTGNGCEVTESYSISEPTAISVATNQVAVTCNGTNDGQITGTITGGTAPYAVALDGTVMETGVTDAFQIDNLFADTYSLVITDDNGCSIAPASITITEPDALTASATVTDVRCFGEATGDIAIAAMGGTSPYEYSLDGTSFQSGNGFSTLAADTYNVTIRDANGCVVVLTETVSEPSALGVIAISASNVSCNGGSDGSFSFAGSGGTLPYTYSLDGVSFKTSPLWENQAAGNYTITILDANACSVTTNWTVTEPDELIGTVSVSGTSSCGVADGTIEVSVQGGTLPYTYSIDGVVNGSSIFSNLAAGSYTIDVADANGCELQLIGSISDPVTAIVTTTVTDVACNGESTGSIIVTVAGGTTPIEYSLDGGMSQTSGAFENLAAGTYNITVEEANQCTQTVTATVSEPDRLVLALSGSDLTCFEDQSGSIEATASGGTGDLTYSIDGTNFQSSFLFTALAAGTYTIHVRDENNCEVTSSITLTQPSELTATATVTDASCTGSSDGSITVTTVNGVAPFTYTLDGGTPQSSGQFDQLDPGTYSIDIEDLTGCTFSLPSVVVEGTTTITTTSTTQNILCAGEQTGSISLTPTGGAAPYEFSLDGGTFQLSGDFSSLSAGTYSITTRDANGCLGSSEVILTEPSALVLNVVQNDKSFELTATGGAGSYEYAVNDGAFQDSNQFPDLAAGNYTFTVRDANGCSTTSSEFSIVLGLAVENVIEIYPNPAAERITIGADEVLTSEIYTIGGKLQGKFQRKVIDVSDFVNGTYLILLKGSEGEVLSINRLVKE